MHWTDDYKTEAELRDALKKVRKDGVVMDGGKIRTPMGVHDSAHSAARGPAWMGDEQPQYLKDTEGMTLHDVASAVAKHPIRADLSAPAMRREAVAIRMGDAWTKGRSDDEVEAAFVSLVATCGNDIAYHKAGEKMANAWRGA